MIPQTTHLPPVTVEQVGSHVAAFASGNLHQALAWAQRDECGEWRVCWQGTWNVDLARARQMAYALAQLVASVELANAIEAPTSGLIEPQGCTAEVIQI